MPTRRATRRWPVVAAALLVVGCGTDDARPAGDADQSTSASKTTTSTGMPGHDGHVNHSGTDVQAVEAALAAAGYQEAGQDGTWEYLGTQPSDPPLAAASMIDTAKRVVTERGWEWLDAAKRDGFTQPTKLIDPLHWFQPEWVADDVIGDPTRPESLVYDPRTGKLLAIMFLVPLGTHGPRVEGSAARWHSHGVPLCYGPDRILPVTPPEGDRCADGSAYGMWSPEMLHIWFVGDDPFGSKMPDVAADALDDANHPS